MKIRTFNYSDGDYRALLDMMNVERSDDPLTVEDAKAGDEARDEQRFFLRLVAEDGGEIVAVAGIGESQWTHVPGKYFVHILVRRDRRRQGVGTALYEHAMRLLHERKPTPAAFTSQAREGDQDSLRFLRRRGYAETMRDQSSELRLERFEPGDWSVVVDSVEAGGVRVRTYAELVDEDPNLQRRMWELDWLLAQDVPEVDPPVRPTFERYRKTFEAPGFVPEAWFVAVDGEEYVGLSYLFRSLAEDGLFRTGLTGVVRSHRRRGIATALKARALAWAKGQGGTRVTTDNADDNPMYQLNVRLGFEPLPAHIWFKKVLGDGGAAPGSDSAHGAM